MAKAITLIIGVIMALFKLSDMPAPPKPSNEAQSVVVKAVATEIAFCKAQGRLAETIGTIRPGTCVHYATAGHWSTHDLVMHLAAQTGPAHLTVATWSLSEPAVRQIVRALGAGRLLSLGLLADWRVPTSCPDALQLARANASRCRLTSVHAKVAVLSGAELSVCVVGSANLTNNPRIEAGVITADPAVAAFHRNWIESELRGASPFDMPQRRPAAGGDDE